MTQLRKEKEARLFQEFQQRQQCMCQQLQTQRKLQQSNEDDLIARAVAEQEAKREVSHDKQPSYSSLLPLVDHPRQSMCRTCHIVLQGSSRFVHSLVFATPIPLQREERQKEESYLSREREIRAHRWLMMAEQAEQRREQEQLDQRLLQQRVLQDQKVAPPPPSLPPSLLHSLFPSLLPLLFPSSSMLPS